MLLLADQTPTAQRSASRKGPLRRDQDPRTAPGSHRPHAAAPSHDHGVGSWLARASKASTMPSRSTVDLQIANGTLPAHQGAAGEKKVFCRAHRKYEGAPCRAWPIGNGKPFHSDIHSMVRVQIVAQSLFTTPRRQIARSLLADPAIPIAEIAKRLTSPCKRSTGISQVAAALADKLEIRSTRLFSKLARSFLDVLRPATIRECLRYANL